MHQKTLKIDFFPIFRNLQKKLPFCKKKFTKILNSVRAVVTDIEKKVKRRSRNFFGMDLGERPVAWKTKMSNITPILLAAQLTKPGKFSGVPLVRKFLIQKKKLSWKDQKTVTETNVVEKWAELYWNALGWALFTLEFCTSKLAECQDLIFAVDP